MHHHVVAEPPRLLQGLVGDQAVQLLAVHAPQGVQGVVGGHGAGVGGAVGGLAVEVGVPGEAGQRAGHGATGGGQTVRLALHQDDRVQGGDGHSWGVRG